MPLLSLSLPHICEQPFTPPSSVYPSLPFIYSLISPALSFSHPSHLLDFLCFSRSVHMSYQLSILSPSPTFSYSTNLSIYFNSLLYHSPSYYSASLVFHLFFLSLSLSVVVLIFPISIVLHYFSPSVLVYKPPSFSLMSPTYTILHFFFLPCRYSPLSQILLTISFLLQFFFLSQKFSLSPIVFSHAGYPHFPLALELVCVLHLIVYFIVPHLLSCCCQ